jgi:hypothetical protein
MTATVLVEHACVRQGRLIVVPHANNSAIVDACNEDARPSKVFKAIDVPGLDEITKAGVGAFLK